MTSSDLSVLWCLMTELSTFFGRECCYESWDKSYILYVCYTTLSIKCYELVWKGKVRTDLFLSKLSSLRPTKTFTRLILGLNLSDFYSLQLSQVKRNENIFREGWRFNLLTSGNLKCWDCPQVLLTPLFQLKLIPVSDLVLQELFRFIVVNDPL